MDADFLAKATIQSNRELINWLLILAAARLCYAALLSILWPSVAAASTAGSILLSTLYVFGTLFTAVMLCQLNLALREKHDRKRYLRVWYVFALTAVLSAWYIYAGFADSGVGEALFRASFAPAALSFLFLSVVNVLMKSKGWISWLPFKKINFLQLVAPTSKPLPRLHSIWRLGSSGDLGIGN